MKAQTNNLKSLLKVFTIALFVAAILFAIQDPQGVLDGILMSLF